jgi:hypothetical protein
MLSGTGYPSDENYPAGTDMELFFTRMRVRVTRRVKFYGYGWALPVGYVPIAILMIVRATGKGKNFLKKKERGKSLFYVSEKSL